MMRASKTAPRSPLTTTRRGPGDDTVRGLPLLATLPLLAALPLLGALALLVGSGCTPDIGTDPIPIVLEFDTLSDPPRTPEPNGVVMNPTTGLIDFTVLGWWLPTYAEDCAHQPAWPAAACEFNVYLETLDGFPTVSSFRAPVSGAIDLASAIPGDTVIVLDDQGQSITDFTISMDQEKGYLMMDRADGWDLGRTYTVAVRGYDDGVRGQDGRRVVATSVYYLLKQQESLVTCRPDPQDRPPSEQVVNTQCKWFELMAMNYGADAAPNMLRDLETLREAYADAHLWDLLDTQADLPRSEVAIVWTVPIHSAAVAELNPNTGKVPVVASNDTLLVRVKGTVDPASLTAFDPLAGAGKGTVIFLNLTALAAEDMANGFPKVTVIWNDTENAIQIKADQPLTNGTLYGVILTGPAPGQDAPRDAVTDAGGRPLVPSPVTVLLRSRGPVVDSLGRSVVSVLSDADAQVLEEGRLQLKDLLDNQTFMSLTRLTRENIVYLYGFEWPNP